MLFRLSQCSKRKIYTGSVGKVLANYAPINSRERPSLFTVDGLSERLYRFKLFFRNSMSLLFIKRSLNDFSRQMFLQDSKLNYELFLNSFFKGDLDAIRSISTPSLFSELLSKIDNGYKNGKQIETIKFVKSPSIIQILPIKINVPKTLDMYQITVKFEYYINSDSFIDYVVFERSSTSSNSKWRICGRIIPNHTYYKSS